MATRTPPPPPTEDDWVEHAENHMLGKTVARVRYLTKEEAAQIGWDCRPLCIQFDDGSIIFPSSDDEGNSAGTMFGQDTPVGLPPGQSPLDWCFPSLWIKREQG